MMSTRRINAIRGLPVLLFLLALLVSTLASANDHKGEIDAIYRLPAFVKEVSTIGTWAYNKGGNGLVRISITEKNDVNKLFVQWLSQKQSGWTVISTVSINEVNEKGRYQIDSYKVSLEQGLRVMHLTLVDRHNRLLKEAKVILTGVGRYKVEIDQREPEKKPGPI